MQYKNIELFKYKQSGFRIDWTGKAPMSNKMVTDEKWQENKKVIYIDPFKLPSNQPMADLILISHEHFDHCDVESIEKISNENTTIICNKLVRKSLGAISDDHFVLLLPKQQIGIAGLIILGLPAYNTTKIKPDGTFYHPKESFGLGFLLSFNIHDDLNNVRIYHMGDTDYIEGAQNPVDLDVLMIPISGTYVMTATEAADASNAIKPKVVVPMHYDAGIVGSDDDAKLFKDLSKSTVEMLAVLN